MKKRDYILIGCILLVAAVCAGFFLLTGKEAQEAVVTVDGEVYGTYSLAKDQTIEIQDGNRLRIQNGQAKMEWADCPDQLCVHQQFYILISIVTDLPYFPHRLLFICG